MSIAPIRHSVAVRPPPARAFELFTRDFARWWPKTMSTGPAPFVDVVLEPRAGGRWFERAADGTETEWGDVLAWEPPGRLLLAWRIGADWAYDPALLTEVELTFAPHGGGTLVTLEHSRLEQFGPGAERVAEQLRGGWPAPLRDFAAFADQPQQEDSHG